MSDDDLIIVVLGILGLTWWYYATPSPAPVVAGSSLAARPPSAAPVAGPPASGGCTSMHPQFTGLDDTSMYAAAIASFRGIYGRDPSMQPGSGPDDIPYWVSISNHMGTFTGGACAAGWNAYWEMKLAGNDSVDPHLLDSPAVFQP
jgi:hypothetical protein